MRVVIAGGGFGGVKAALELAKDKKFHITLVSEREDFLYYPALYATTTGGSRLESSVPLARILGGHENVHLVKDKITSIDIGARTLIGARGRYHYDSCVLALGVVTSYFGINGLAENSFGIKSLDEVAELKSHLHDLLSEDKHFDKNYFVVGAGPTGVELSAAMTTYIARIARAHRIKRGRVRVSLIEAAPRVLPRMSERASRRVQKRLKDLGVIVRTGQKVEGADHDSLAVNGRDLPSRTIIWTSGVTNNPFFAAHEHVFHLAKNGRVEVDEHLRAAPHVYVIGDNAATPYTGLAQTALHDAVFIARHLRRLAHNEALVPYRVRKPPVVVPVGENWAVFEWGSLLLSGRIASMIRQAADFTGYNDVLPISSALGVWFSQFDSEETCLTCLTATTVPVSNK